ncbi:MAG: hypothetical protein HYY44_05730 [Deltaproteobacteria bacterium]|nr:hypothetical protein [Deltaproteobacteria bacterium]
MDIWDAGAGFFAAIFAAGFLLGWIERRRTWRWAFGIFAGPALLSLPSLRREFAHGLGRDWFGYAFFWAMLLFLASVFLAAFAGSYAGTKAGGRGMK